MVIKKKEPGVAAVNRALSILLAFEKSVEGMTLAEISAVTGLYHSTILRLCESLEHAGFINRLDDGRFMLGAKPFYLGMLYQETFRIWDYAAPVMRTLVRDTKETAAIYIREGNDRVCLHRMVQPRAVRMHVREGEIVELDKGAAGKVLLAFSGEKGERFDLIRQSYYSVSMSERGSEAAAIACPIFGPKQTLICSISLGMPVFRFDRKVFKEFLPLVMSAAAAITKKCGGDPTVFSPPYKHMSKVIFATKK